MRALTWSPASIPSILITTHVYACPVAKIYQKFDSRKILSLIASNVKRVIIINI